MTDQKIPIGLQLYSVRHEMARDPGGTLKKVAAMGYSGVEFFGAPRHSADELRAMLDEAGLVCCGWHTPYALVQEDTLFPTIAFNKALDNDKIIVPSLPRDLTQTRAGWLEQAHFFNQLGEKLAHYEMMTGYHNHGVEFQALDGEWPWYTLFDNTDAAVVMQFDTGNALVGNLDVDVTGVIERYPGRAVAVHIKPFSKALARAENDPMAGTRPVFGEDDTDWAGFFAACESVGNTTWYIVEYESDKYPPLEAVDRCLQALRGLGK